MAYILSSFNRFDQWDREHCVYKYEINGNWYGIMRVEMEWGLPKLGYRIDQDRKLELLHIFETEDEAREFVRYMKELAR